MKLYAISAESSGRFPTPYQSNLGTHLVALRIVDLDTKAVIYSEVFSRDTGESVNSDFHNITDQMVAGKPTFSSQAASLKEWMLNPAEPKMFLCMGLSFYQELFRRYGIARDGLFLDMLPMITDVRDMQARVNMPSNAPGTKQMSIPEAAEFMGKDEPKTPEQKTDVICSFWDWKKSNLVMRGVS